MSEESGAIQSGSLDKLLQWDGKLDSEVKMTFPRDDFDLEVMVQSMSPELNRKIELECTDITKKGGIVTRDMNERKYLVMQIYNCVKDPDLSDDKLQAKFNSNDSKKRPYLIVFKIFRTGEQIKLSRMINRLSGFATDVDTLDNEIEDLLIPQED